MQRLRTTRCSHGLSSIGRSVVAQRAVRAQERLLDDALGVADARAQRARGDGVQAPRMAVVDRLERVLPPRAEEPHQVLVGAEAQGGSHGFEPTQSWRRTPSRAG